MEENNDMLTTTLLQEGCGKKIALDMFTNVTIKAVALSGWIEQFIKIGPIEVRALPLGFAGRI